jgi:hypothetical protein
MKNLGFHYRLIAALRAPLNPDSLFRIHLVAVVKSLACA